MIKKLLTFLLLVFLLSIIFSTFAAPVGVTILPTPTIVVAKKAEASISANQTVLDVANSIPSGGGYCWVDPGIAKSLYHNGELVLAQETQCTQCCGYTLTVAFIAAENLGLFEGQPTENLLRFKESWFGDSPGSEKKLLVFALEELGVGYQVAPKDALPGDFLQFWRSNGSGHSVIFLGWVTNKNGKVTGIKYRSSQPATNGIGNAKEFLAGSGGAIDTNQMYFGRFNSQ